MSVVLLKMNRSNRTRNAMYIRLYRVTMPDTFGSDIYYQLDNNIYGLTGHPVKSAMRFIEEEKAYKEFEKLKEFYDLKV